MTVNDSTAEKIIDAYKFSPLLTGLLALNLITLIGGGYFLLHILDNVMTNTRSYVENAQKQVLLAAESCRAGDSK